MCKSPRKRKNVVELIFEEIRAKMFLKPTKDILPRIREVLRITTSINTKKTTPRYIIVKLLKDREGNDDTTDSWLSTENMLIGQWNDIFKAMKDNKCQCAILHREKSFKKKKSK